MPIIVVKMFEGRDVEQKRRLAHAVTGAVTECLGVDAQAVRILIEEYPREHWAVAGTLIADRPG